MYAVGDRVVLAFEPLVGEAGTIKRLREDGAYVLLDLPGPLGLPIIAFVGFDEGPPGGQSELDFHP